VPARADLAVRNGGEGAAERRSEGSEDLLHGVERDAADQKRALGQSRPRCTRLVKSDRPIIKTAPAVGNPHRTDNRWRAFVAPRH